MGVRLPLGLIGRWWWLIVVAGALGVAAALIVARSVAPVYRATSTLFIVPPGEASLNQSFARTYAYMAVHPVVLDRVRELLALPPSVKLDAGVTARPVPDTQLVAVVAEHGDPLVARDIANAVAHVFAEQQDLPIGPAGPAVRVGQLAVTPDQPVNPSPVPALLLGAVIGVLVGLGVSLLLETLRPFSAPVGASSRRTTLESDELEPTRKRPERIGRLELARGAIVVAVAALALVVSFAAGPVFRGSAEQLPAPQAQPAPVEIVSRPVPRVADVPAVRAPGSSGAQEIVATTVASPIEAIPATSDLPAGVSPAVSSPQAEAALQAPETADATTAVLPVESIAANTVPVSAEVAVSGGTAGLGAAAVVAAVPPAPSTRVLFEDRFVSGPQLWPNDPQGPARYEGTAYRLQAREPGQFVAVAAPFGQPLRDALVTASFTKVGGPAGGVYGLIVRDSGPAPRDGANQVGNFYVLGIDDRGQHGVWRREGGRWVDIVPLTASEAVRPGGGTNELAALAIDDLLSLTVNGVEVATVLGTEPRPGGLGVYVAGELNEVQLNRFEVQPAAAPTGPASAASFR